MSAVLQKETTIFTLAGQYYFYVQLGISLEVTRPIPGRLHFLLSNDTDYHFPLKLYCAQFNGTEFLFFKSIRGINFKNISHHYIVKGLLHNS